MFKNILSDTEQLTQKSCVRLVGKHKDQVSLWRGILRMVSYDTHLISVYYVLSLHLESAGPL